MESLNLSFNGRKTGAEIGSVLLAQDSRAESKAEENFRAHFRREEFLERMQKGRESSQLVATHKLVGPADESLESRPGPPFEGAHISRSQLAYHEYSSASRLRGED